MTWKGTANSIVHTWLEGVMEMPLMQLFSGGETWDGDWHWCAAAMVVWLNDKGLGKRCLGLFL